MKCIKNIFLAALAAAVVFIPMTAEKTPTIDDLLAPYQAVINKVNGELGSKIYIPAESKEKVYNNIKGMTASEFESQMRTEYLDSLKSQTPKETSSNGLPRIPKSGSVISLGPYKDMTPQERSMIGKDYMIGEDYFSFLLNTEKSENVQSSSPDSVKAPIPKDNSTSFSAKDLPKSIWTPLPNATGEITVTPLH